MAQKSNAKNSQPEGATGKSTARGLIDEVEKAGEILLREIKEGFDTISDKVSVAAKSAAEGIADTTASVADKVSKTHTSHQIRSALDHIETVGERVIDAIGDRFEILKSRVVATSKPVAKKKKKAIKKTAVAKKVAKKKKVANKASKKKAVKKTPLQKVAKKKVTKKKVVSKKAAKKKVSSKRRTS